MDLSDEIQSKFSNSIHKLLVNIVYTGNFLNHYHNQILRPHELTIQQFNILRILRGRHPQPASVRLLTQRMLDKNSNASRLVEKLRKKNWVKRTECGEDRRRVDVIITEEGLNLLEQIDDKFTEHISWIGGLEPEKIEISNQTLDLIREKIQSHI